MPDRPSATADVATAVPGRYAEQLAAHFGRRCEVREEGYGVRIVSTDGDCLVQAREEALHSTVGAPSQEQVDRLAQVVGSHLERFGQRTELMVAWRSA